MWTAPTPLVSCEKCPFGGACVSSKGDITSPFVIVGESPGASEVAAKKPFVGASGKMITDILQQSGLPDNIEPFWTNALQCFPKADKQNNLAFATNNCRNRLIAEIQMHPRKVILALGNAAVWALTNQFGTKITQIRGKLYESPLAERGIVAAVHPAFLLRGGGSLPQFRNDIGYAVNLLTDGKKKEPRPVKWFLASTLEHLDWIEEEYRDAPLKAADIETTGFNFVDDRILCLGITKDGENVHIIPSHLIYEHKWLIDLLLSQGKWIWHNGKFDVRWFWQLGIWNARVDHDTLLQSYALDETRGMHDLEQVAGNVLGAPNYKAMLDQWVKGKHPDGRKKNYGDVPPNVLYNYAAFDLANTFQIHEKLYPQVCADPQLNKLYHEVLIPASQTLGMAELEGMEVDREVIDFNIADLKVRMQPHIDVIQEAATRLMAQHINLNSWQQVDRLLYTAMKLGKPGQGTDADTLERLEQVPVVVALQEYRKLNKLLGTYAVPIPDYIATDRRIHTTFLIHGTVTGRLASRDPNQQNMPRGPYIRRMFIPGKGYKFVKIDLNQAELRVLAIISRCAELIRIYCDINAPSIHHLVSTKFFGEGYTKEEKMRAKAVTFGIVYGRTAFDLAREFSISVSEAHLYIKMWFEQFPEAEDCLNNLAAAPTNNLNLVTAFGRKKRWGVVSYDKLRDLQNQAKNFPMQSIASDITLTSAGRTWKPMREMGVNLCNLVHDETMWKTPDCVELQHYVVHKVAQVYRQVPVDFGLTLVPFIGEGEVGDRWGELEELGSPNMDYVRDVESWLDRRVHKIGFGSFAAAA